jgi:hypothetical protein
MVQVLSDLWYVRIVTGLCPSRHSGHGLITVRKTNTAIGPFAPFAARRKIMSEIEG